MFMSCRSSYNRNKFGELRDKWAISPTTIFILFSGIT